MLADQSRSGGLPVIPVGLANQRPTARPASMPPPTAVAAAPLLPLPSLSTLPTSPTVDKAKETAAEAEIRQQTKSGNEGMASYHLGSRSNVPWVRWSLVYRKAKGAGGPFAPTGRISVHSPVV